MLFEEKFLNTINDCINGVKIIIFNLSEKLIDSTLNFFSLFRESLEIPLNLINDNTKNFKRDIQVENILNIMTNSLNIENKFIHISPIKYNLKSLNFQNNNANENKVKKHKINTDNYFYYKKYGYIKFEDGLEDIGYFQDDSTLNTVKEMINNFELINYNGLIIKIEEEKNITNKYISKIISYMSDNKLKNNDNILNVEEKTSLNHLLREHHNRIIFLQKLNNYRALGRFQLRDNE